MQKNMIIQVLIDGVTYEAMVKTTGEMVWLNDTVTVSAKIAEIVKVLNLKATTAYVDEKIAALGTPKDGVSPTVEVIDIEGGHRITITDAEGTKTVDVMDGEDGHTPQKGVDYFDGKDGTSVTVKSVSESTADGGSNVVTFSDGKTVTIKNGSKGSDGSAGKDGDDGTDGLAIYAYNGDFGVATIAGDDASVTYDSASVISLGNRTLQIGDLLIDISGNVVFVSDVYIGNGFSVEYVTTIHGAPGNDGIDGLSFYAYSGAFDPSSGGQGKEGDFITSKITSLGTRTLQNGDLLIDEVGNVYRVTSLYYDATEFDAEYVTTITGATGANGVDGADGKTPVKGTDYFTEADKDEMVNSVIASLKTETWTFTLEDGSTVNKVVLLK